MTGIYRKAALRVVDKALHENYKATRKELKKLTRVKDVDNLVDVTKRIADEEFGVLWAFDAGPTENTATGRFRVAPTHDTNVTQRMVYWNLTHISRSVQGLRIFPRAMLRMGYISVTERDTVQRLLEGSASDIKFARDLMCEAIVRVGDRGGPLVGAQ